MYYKVYSYKLKGEKLPPHSRQKTNKGRKNSPGLFGFFSMITRAFVFLLLLRRHGRRVGVGTLYFLHHHGYLGAIVGSLHCWEHTASTHLVLCLCSFMETSPPPYSLLLSTPCKLTAVLTGLTLTSPENCELPHYLILEENTHFSVTFTPRCERTEGLQRLRKP